MMRTASHSPTTNRNSAGARWLGVAFLCAVMLFSSLTSASAQAIDPSDLWFRAFLLLKEGEESEKNDTLKALNKYVESKRMLDGLASDHPEFHSEIVKYRRTELSEKIPMLRQMLSQGMTAGNNGQSLFSPGGSISQAPIPQPAPEYDPRNAGLPTWQQPGSVPTQHPGVQPQQPYVTSPPGGGSPNYPPQQPIIQQNQEYIPAPVYPPSQPITQPGSQNVVNSIAAQMQQQFTDLQNRIAQREQENLYLQNQIAERDQRLNLMAQEVQNAKQRADQLQREKMLAEQNATSNPDAEKEVQRLATLYDEAMEGWQAALEMNEQMAAERDEMEKEIASLQKEKAKVESERDKLRAIVDSSGDGAKAQIAKLTDENTRLREKLDETRELAERLAQVNSDQESDLRERDATIVLLKQRVTEIDEERQRLIDENSAYESTIDELKAQLQGLASGSISPEALVIASASPEASAENELLREVVLRQIRRQNQIKQSRELLIEELNQIGPEAQNLLAMVEGMFQESGLTPAEKEMFRGNDEAFAVIEESPTESESMAITVDGEGVLERQDIQEELDQIQKVAQLAYNEQDYVEAEAQYARYLTYRPRNVTCITNLGLVKYKTGQFDKATALLEKAISIEADYGKAHYYLGRAYLSQGKTDEALTSLKQSIECEPTNSRAFNIVGVIYSEKDLVGEAEEAFNSAVEIDPEYADAHFNLAVLHATKDAPNVQKAGDHYYRAVDLGSPRDDRIEQFLDASSYSASLLDTIGAVAITSYPR